MANRLDVQYLRTGDPSIDRFAREVIDRFRQLSVAGPAGADGAAGAAGADGGPGTASWKDAVTVAQTAAFAANTVSAGAGTITMNAVGIVTVDGRALVLDDSVLVWLESAGANAAHGIYEVTTEGTASVAAVFTRRTDADGTGELLTGTRVGVNLGTTYLGRVFRMTTTGTVTIGTTAHTWVLDTPSRRPNYAATTTPILNWKLSEGVINSNTINSPNSGSGGTAAMTNTGTNWYQQGPDASICGEGCIRASGAVASTYLSAPGTIQTGTAAITVTCWCVPYESATAGADASLAGLYVTGGLGYQWKLGIDNTGKPFYDCNVGGVAKRATATTVVERGRDYYLAGTYDGSTVRIMVNGLEQAALSAVGTLYAAGTSPLYGMGNIIPGALIGNVFNGVFEELAIYDSVLYSDALLKHTRRGQGRIRTV